MFHDPSGRVQVRQLGDLMHPGACALCGSGNNEEGYVDTSIYYDYEGQVYFCLTCAREIAKAAGCLLPDETSHLRDVSEEIAINNKRLEEQNANLLDRLSAYDRLLDDAIARRDATSDAKPEPEPEPVGDSNPAERADGRKPIAKKSVAGRRPNDAKQPTVRNGQFPV